MTHNVSQASAMNLTEFSQLKNRIDEVLSRSSSATLQSHRTLSSPTEVSYVSNIAPVHHQNALTVETNKTAYPIYTSQVHVASPTYSFASPRLDTVRNDSDLYRSISNYQVKTIHDLGSVVRPLPTHHRVEEVRSATYPSTYTHQGVGYDRQKLDQIIARIQGNTPTLEVTKTLSAPVYEASESKKSGAFNKIEADEESFIKDRKTKNRRAEEEEEEDQETEEKQKEIEEESPTKRRSTNKRQEVLSAKKQPQDSNKKEKEVSSPEPKNLAKKEEAPKGSAPTGQEKKSEAKNDLVMLPKKPSLRNSYNFGKEQRRGGSSLLQDARFRE